MARSGSREPGKKEIATVKGHVMSQRCSIHVLGRLNYKEVTIEGKTFIWLVKTRHCICNSIEFTLYIDYCKPKVIGS